MQPQKYQTNRLHWKKYTIINWTLQNIFILPTRIKKTLHKIKKSLALIINVIVNLTNIERRLMELTLIAGNKIKTEVVRSDNLQANYLNITVDDKQIQIWYYDKDGVKVEQH